MNIRRQLSLFALLLALVTGCQTLEGGKPKPTASLVTHNPSAALLGQAVLDVFNAEGYTPVTNSYTEFVFEKPGSTWNNITYGSMLNPTVWFRVKVQIEPVDSTTHRLVAEAYLIRDKGATLEEQEHLGRNRSGTYKKLLEAVVAKAGGI